MEYRALAPSVSIPVLGLGTLGLGGFLRANTSRDEEYVQAIRRAIDAGMTHIDTAEVYGAGHTEELVGRAIQGYDRQKVFITTKVSPHHLWFRRHIHAAVERSLKRLGTHYIDLYLVHFPNPLVPLRNTMATLDDLVSRGLVRFIGVSNFSVGRLRNAQRWTSRVVTDQVKYSLQDQGPQKDLLPYCQQAGMLLTAYSPLGRGRLVAGRHGALDEAARKYGRSPIQVALRWLIDQPNVVAIPKAASPAHLEEILGCLGWQLEEEDARALGSAFSHA